MEDENLLREVVGDDKNDKKRVANLTKKIVTMKKCYYLSKIV